MILLIFRKKTDMNKFDRIGCLFGLLLLCAWLPCHAQENLLCQGDYWTEDEACRIMKQWASEWTTKGDWEKRAGVIRQGLIKGMKLDQMPK